MKNKIIYGSCGTGKTRLCFVPEIENFKGFVIAISAKEIPESYFTDLSQFNIKDLKKIKYDFDDTKEEKIIGTVNISKALNDYNKELKVILNSINYLNLHKPILIAIDEFVQFDLNEEPGSKSILLKLLENDNINIVICFQSLLQLKEIYKEEYESILSKCELISSKNK